MINFNNIYFPFFNDVYQRQIQAIDIYIVLNKVWSNKTRLQFSASQPLVVVVTWAQFQFQNSRTAFKHIDPKWAKKRQSSQQCHFFFWEPTSVKAAHKTLVKLTPTKQNISHFGKSCAKITVLKHRFWRSKIKCPRPSCWETARREVIN